MKDQLQKLDQDNHKKENLEKIAKHEEKKYQAKLANMEENGIFTFMKNEMDRVWHQMNIVNEENAKLRREMADVKEKNSEIAKENKLFVEKIAKMEEENLKLEEEIEQKDENLAKKEEKIRALNDKTAKQKKEIEEMRHNHKYRIFEMQYKLDGKDLLLDERQNKIYEMVEEQRLEKDKKLEMKEQEIRALHTEIAELKRMKVDQQFPVEKESHTDVSGKTIPVVVPLVGEYLYLKILIY